MEHQYGGNTHRKDAIRGSNAPSSWCCCCYCPRVGAVDTTTGNFVKINSATTFLAQNKNKISIKFAQTNTVLK